MSSLQVQTQSDSNKNKSPPFSPSAPASSTTNPMLPHSFFIVSPLAPGYVLTYCEPDPNSSTPHTNTQHSSNTLRVEQPTAEVAKKKRGTFVGTFAANLLHFGASATNVVTNTVASTVGIENKFALLKPKLKLSK